MSNILVCYASLRFFYSQRRLVKTALRNGIDKVLKFNTVWLKSQKEFCNSNKEILTQKKGSGYWLWKPYIILKTLERISEGDSLIYADSGMDFINNIDHLLDIPVKENGIALFQVHQKLCKEWTKRDCFVYTDSDSEEFYESNQVVSGFLILKKNSFTLEFIRKWLLFCQNIRIVSDNPNTCGLPNLPGFVAHRHDQSVLSLLAAKYHIPLYRDPSQFGNNWKAEDLRVYGEFLDPGYYEGNYSDSPCHNSIYPTIVNIHRKRSGSRRLKMHIISLFIDKYKVDRYLNAK